MIDVATWKQLQTTLKTVKVQEMNMRKEICNEIGTDIDLSEKGRATVKTHVQGYDLKAVYTLSYNLDKDELAAIWNDLTEKDRNAIKLVPELKMKEYKALSEDSLLHQAVTSKPAAPTLEAKEPEE